MPQPHSARLIAPLWGLIAAAILCNAGPAGAAPLSLEYALGFNDTFQLGAWTPLTVVLENRGRATQGTVEVIVTSGSEYRGDIRETRHVMDVDLPYNARKLCAFTLQITTFTHALVIRFRQDDDMLLARTINLRPYYTTDRLLVVADESIAPNFLAGLPTRFTAASLRHTRFLPETWYGYDSVDLLILRASLFKDLRERQWQALVQWIEQGGCLVTAADLNYGAFQNPRHRQVLPMTITGHQQVSALSSLQAFCGYALRSDEPFLVLRTAAPGMQILAQEADTPIVLQKTIGRGRLFFLAFDPAAPPFSYWTHRQAFWEALLARRPTVDRTGPPIASQRVLDSLTKNLPADFPSAWRAYLFIGVYLACSGIALRSLPLRLRISWKIAALFGSIILLFSAVGYMLFMVPGLQRHLTFNSFLHLHLNPRTSLAAGRSWIGLYALHGTEYKLDFRGVKFPIMALHVDDASRHRLPGHRVHETPQGQIIRGRASRWSSTFFQAAPDIAFPLTGSGRVEDTQIRLTFENQTPYTLVDCAAYLPVRTQSGVEQRFVWLDEIAPGTQQKTVSRAAMRSPGSFDMLKTGSFDLHTADVFIKAMTADAPSSFLTRMQAAQGKEVLSVVHQYCQGRHDTVCCIGWLSAGGLPIPVNASDIPGEHLTLLTWELPLAESIPADRHKVN